MSRFGFDRVIVYISSESKDNEASHFKKTIVCSSFQVRTLIKLLKERGYDAHVHDIILSSPLVAKL